MATPRTLLITTLAVSAAPDPDVTCVPSKMDLRIIMCSDGRSLRFDWNALLEILAQPRLHLLAER